MNEEKRAALPNSVAQLAMQKSRGERIKFLREAQSPAISRPELAKLGGWHDNTVGGWERDETAPSPENCLKLAEILGVPVEMVLIA